MKKKRVVGFVAMLLLVFSLFTTVSGVEYAEEDQRNVKLRWSYKENSKYTLNVYNGLGSSHGGYPCVNNAIVLMNREINKYRNNIQVKSSPYAGSNVRYSVPNKSSWETFNFGTVFATTIPRSTQGTFYYGFNSLPPSGTIYINFAMIWYNPAYEPEMSGAFGNRMAMHEMLHVFGMGHYRDGVSLTNDRTPSTSTSLSAYDAEQFRTMYP